MDAPRYHETIMQTFPIRSPDPRGLAEAYITVSSSYIITEKKILETFNFQNLSMKYSANARPNPFIWQYCSDYCIPSEV